MKRKLLMALVIITNGIGITSCSSDKNELLPEVQFDPDPAFDPDNIDDNLLNDFWFGYYQEDALTNPEDPLPGFIYLKIPVSGNFNGQLYFSYSGCEGGVDIGRAEGTVANGNLDGSWEGDVDGRAVGGTYAGELIGSAEYNGTYTNDGGKVEIECDEYFTYYVAPNGTWILQKTGDNEMLNISVNMNTNPLSLIWQGGENVAGYSVVFVDAECLENSLELEECLMWSGISTTNSIVYGEGISDDVPALPLVSGKTYLASITCVADSGEATVSSNITFIY